MKNKKDYRIIVSFLGGSSSDVTGSAILISYPTKESRKCILLECGMIQGFKSEQIYSDNKKMVESIPVSDIDAVFLGHPHCDHSGNLSIFGSEKFKGQVIMSNQCAPITEELLINSEFLHSVLIKALNFKGKKAKPLHTEVDMYNMFDKIKYCDTHKKYQLDDYVTYEFYNSGHVLGGNQILFTFKLPNNSTKSLVYTSDLGSEMNRQYKPFVKPMEVIPKATAYIFEGTYGQSSKCFKKNKVEFERNQLISEIKETILNNKRVFIPSFSFGRTQELMTLFYERLKDEDWFNDVPIYVDGLLTNNICHTYDKILEGEDNIYWNKVMSWKNFRYNKKREGTLSLLSKREKGIYIASPGFIQPGTRSCDYIKNFMEHTGDLICFVGYFGGEGSISYELVNKPIHTPIKIDGTTIMKNCNVIAFSTFSSHIQQEEILNYWKQINTNRIIIHHASDESKDELTKLGKDLFEKQNKTTQVVGVSNCAWQFVL